MLYFTVTMIMISDHFYSTSQGSVDFLVCVVASWQSHEFNPCSINFLQEIKVMVEINVVLVGCLCLSEHLSHSMFVIMYFSELIIEFFQVKNCRNTDNNFTASSFIDDNCTFRNYSSHKVNKIKLFEKRHFRKAKKEFCHISQ